jgi:hypothetical protein
MHSFRNKEHPTININNLLILNGPEKNGKSWFLRHNLKLFSEKEAEYKPLVIHYDLREIPNQNFYSFLFNFEKVIIKGIVQRNEYEKSIKKKSLINVEILKDLLFYRWEKGWLEINLSKSLKRVIDEGKSPYSFYISYEYNDEILSLIEKYERKPFKQYHLIENFDRIVTMIKSTMNVDELEAALLLIQDCLIQREDFRKDKDIFDNELYRDGLDTMHYVFDVLNHIAGYHDIQIKEESEQNVDDKKPIYPHIVLALESVQQFFEMKDCEKRPIQYLQTMMLRLLVI